MSTRSYSFEFNNVEMPYESYNGVNVRLRCVGGAQGAASAMPVARRTPGLPPRSAALHC